MKESVEQELERLRLTIENVNVGVWQWNLKTGKEWWSANYYRLLGYEPGEVEPSGEFFLESILHPSHRNDLDHAFKKHLSSNEPFRLSLRLRTKDGSYQWFINTGSVSRDEQGEPSFMAGSIVNIEREVQTNIEFEKSQLFLEETGRLAKVGGWEVDLEKMITHWSKTVYDIHEVPYDEIVPVEDGINFYHPDDRPRIQADFGRAVEKGTPYNDTYRIITRTGRELYVHAVAIPIIDKQGKVTTVRGIFQDIDQKKRASILMEETLAIANDQNQRLINFAHIVSHNLRNHSSNLEMLLGFIRETEEKQDFDLLLNKLDQVVHGLSATIGHLNDIVQVQTTIEHHLEEVSLQEFVHKTLNVLSADLERIEANLDIRISEDIVFRFTPAYLDSILINLISNAIKYRDPDRKLELKIIAKRNIEESTIEILFKDNGLGLDTEKYSSRLFKMYATFHEHPEARGVGLFITKNQLESLGGHISVKGTPGIGTEFKVVIPENQ